MFNRREPIDLEVREPSVEPCWIDSLDESRSSFFSAIERMHGWFEFMSDQIIRLKSMANITPLEVSRSHTVKLNIFKLNLQIYQVRFTLRIKRACYTIVKYIRSAQKELTEKGRRCTPINCVCDDKFDLCPFEQFMNE